VRSIAGRVGNSIVTLAVLVIASAQAGTCRVEVAVAPHLAVALDTRMPEFHQRADVHQAVQMLLTPFIHTTAEQVRLCLEYDRKRPGETRQIDLPPATLREQLDAVVAVFGCTWQALGEWVVVTPRSANEGAGWFPAQKVGGPVAVSYATDCSEFARSSSAAPLADAMASNAVHIAPVHVVSIVIPGKPWVSVKASEPQKLQDPTWREALLTWRAQGGFNVVQWVVTPREPKTGILTVREAAQTLQPLSLYVNKEMRQ